MTFYRHALAAFLFAVTLSTSPLLRAEAHGEDSESADATIPEPLYFASEGSTRVGGRTIDYDVVAATMEIKDKEGEVIAHFGYTAYTRKGGDRSTRPILFAYNGGPGSASMWLHMGILGPQRADIDDVSINTLVRML